MRSSPIILWILALSLFVQPCMSAMLTVCDCASRACACFGEPEDAAAPAPDACCQSGVDHDQDDDQDDQRNTDPSPAPADDCDHDDTTSRPCCSAAPIPHAVAAPAIIGVPKNFIPTARGLEPVDQLPEAALSRLRRPPRAANSI